MRGSVEIVMMHRVMPEPLPLDDPYHKITVTTAQLEDYLKNRQDWIPMPLHALKAGKIPQGQHFIITFDDGYKDNMIHALPLLEKYNVPATIFVGTRFIDGDLEPFEILLDRVLRQANIDKKIRNQVYNRLFRGLKRGSLAKRHKKLEGIAKNYGVHALEPVVGDFMNWDEVIEMDRHPLITIGSHTCTHSVLWKVNPLLVWNELGESRRILEEKLGHSVDLVSYPYGRHNALSRFFAGKIGYNLGCLTDPGIVSEENFSRFALPRIDLNGDNISYG